MYSEYFGLFDMNDGDYIWRASRDLEAAIIAMSYNKLSGCSATSVF